MTNGWGCSYAAPPVLRKKGEILFSRQIIILFSINLLSYLVGNSIMALLPIYFDRIGIKTTHVGFFLSLAFGGMAAGTWFSGWLANRIDSYRSILLRTSVLSVLPIFLMGQITTRWLLLLAMLVIWFAAGVTTATIAIAVGSSVKTSHRGVVFGTLGMTSAVSQIIGGSISGLIVESWNFQGLFAFAAGVQLGSLLPILLLSGSQSTNLHVLDLNEQKPQRVRFSMSRSLFVLVWASVLAHTLTFSSDLGRPILMERQGFSPMAISSIVSFTGLMGLLLPVILGWLSDRVGRRHLLILCYSMLGGGVLLLAVSHTLWDFRLAAILIAVNGAAMSVGSAMVADVTQPDKLAMSMAQFQMTPWFGAVIGFSVSGIAFEVLDFRAAFALGGLLPVMSILMIVWGFGTMKVRRRQYH